MAVLTKLILDVYAMIGFSDHANVRLWPVNVIPGSDHPLNPITHVVYYPQGGYRDSSPLRNGGSGHVPFLEGQVPKLVERRRGGSDKDGRTVSQADPVSDLLHECELTSFHSDRCGCSARNSLSLIRLTSSLAECTSVHAGKLASLFLRLAGRTYV